MFLGVFKEKTRHSRSSKLGKVHEYYRELSFVKLRCDVCDENFTRPKGSIDPKRLSNNYFHVCKNCDAKRFAQKKGKERKNIWNLNASSDLPIGKL